MGNSSSHNGKGIPVHEEERQEDSGSDLTILMPEEREEKQRNEDESGEQDEKSQSIDKEVIMVVSMEQKQQENVLEAQSSHLKTKDKTLEKVLHSQPDEGSCSVKEEVKETETTEDLEEELSFMESDMTLPGPKVQQRELPTCFADLVQEQNEEEVKFTCKNWKNVLRIALYSLCICGTLGNSCDVGKDQQCPKFGPYERFSVPYGESVPIHKIPDLLHYYLKIDIFHASEELDCGEAITSKNHTCSVRTWEPNNTSCPGFSVEQMGNITVISYLNATEELNYCSYVDGTNYHHVHQGGFVITNIPSAPTCSALPTAAFVNQSGCEQDPPGQVKPGSVCHFSCPDGYIGHGDVKKTCKADGTWSSTNFTCEAVTCPADNIARPLQTGCDLDSSGQVKVGSICSFPCPSGDCTGDIQKVCLLNGTWTSTSFTFQAVTCPALNVTRPLQTECFMDSSDQIKVGSICSFSSPSGYEGKSDVQKVCLPNGTWTTTSINSPGAGHDLGWCEPSFGVSSSINILLVALLGWLIYKIRRERTSGGQHRQDRNGAAKFHNGTNNGYVTVSGLEEKK